MGDVIQLDEFKFPWKEVFTLDGMASTLQIYANERTGEIEVVQMNDDNEVIRTPISAGDTYQLVDVLTRVKMITNKEKQQ
jgi:hypothetical protein